jgi:hypothetical protein
MLKCNNLKTIVQLGLFLLTVTLKKHVNIFRTPIFEKNAVKVCLEDKCQKFSV